MAEIHPNDIGLATFADVGDVEKLKTSAKNVVDALNEIYQNGTQGGSFGEQWYVDGENNVIIGENNIVYGNNNLIICFRICKGACLGRKQSIRKNGGIENG